MEQTLIISAVAAFFSTTVDDFAVMLIFFGRALLMDDVRVGYLKVIAGQTIGFSIVIIVSLLGILLGIFIPQGYISLIGFFPLFAGLLKAYEVYTEEFGGSNCCAVGNLTHSGDSAKKIVNKNEYTRLACNDIENDIIQINQSEVSTNNKLSLNKSDQRIEVLASDYHDSNEKNENKLPLASYGSGDRSSIEMEECTDKGEYLQDGIEHDNFTDKYEEVETNCLSKYTKQICVGCMDPFVLEVMVFALVCSSDNIGIYLAMFATMNQVEVFVVIILFYVLLAFNIMIAIFLMKCTQIADCFQNTSQYFVPPMLIGLGLYILSDSIISPWH